RTGVAVNAANVTTVTGLFADVQTAYNANTAGTITGLGNEDVALTDATVSVADINTMNGLTSGVVTATVDSGDYATLSGITESGNALTLTVTGGVTVDQYNNLDAITTGTIVYDIVDTFTVVAAASNAVINDATTVTANGSGVDNVIDLSVFTAGNGYNKGATINGLGGNDIIYGSDFADTITGGLGADTITGGAGDDSINLTESTSSADTVVFAATAVANGTDTVTGFTAGTDLLNVSAFETVGALVDGTGTYTIAAGQVVYLGGQAAGAADSTAAAITALNSAGVVTAATQTNWIVISDDNSTAIYSALNIAGNTEYTGATLTLVATIDTAITHAQLATAIVI
ncbi:MAG TPA: hypothetical protein PLU46_03180, partial [Thiotrichales bacterium]|nr:hypothetical protein [Thiotrichales bacterium]